MRISGSTWLCWLRESFRHIKTSHIQQTTDLWVGAVGVWGESYFSLWHLDTVEQEMKRQVRPNCALDGSQERKSHRVSAWWPSSRAKAMIRFLVWGDTPTALFCFVALLSLIIHVGPVWWMSKSRLGCTVTLGMFIISPCACMSCSDNWICICWWDSLQSY